MVVVQVCGMGRSRKKSQKRERVGRDEERGEEEEGGQ